MLVPIKPIMSCDSKCPKCMTYKEYCDENEFSLANINFGDVEYDTSTIAGLFDKFYACWFINAGCLDFKVELQNCYDLAKDRIDAYLATLADFTPYAKTTMGVDYGKRKTTGKGYDYPVTGIIDDSKPSSGDISETDAVKDTTTVEKNENPFKTLREFKDFGTFAEFFIYQFKDCFTLCEAMTW